MRSRFFCGQARLFATYSAEVASATKAGKASVGEEGLEPSFLSEHGPKPCAYTNSATRPKIF